MSTINYRGAAKDRWGNGHLNTSETRWFIERDPLVLSDPQCAGEDTKKWHPAPRRSLTFKRVVMDNQEALQLCYACPDRVACLQYALEYEEKGIWGGVIESARRGVDSASADWLIESDLRKRRELGLD